MKIRRRATALAGAAVATLALVPGPAHGDARVPAPPVSTAVRPLAADTALRLAAAVRAQADAQRTAATAAMAAEARHAAAGARRAQEAAKRHAARKAAAERKARASRAAERLRRAWVRPVDGHVLGAPFGIGGRLWSHRHSGQDFVVPTGTPVRAVHSGTVVEAGWGGAYGYHVVIKHGPGTYTQYGHLSALAVHTGQRVGTGQRIGRSGSTGNSTGPHLHFEARTRPVYGFAVPPLAFLRARGVAL
ncbi:M23 family metallopeptidase [Streptomyces sp. NPDC000410]|uniref:M23 family metallopeptidase n=1 Tax=Streptomyces sp. NPDC000410 TaxID=3154254 RepID=UPI003316EAA7